MTMYDDTGYQYGEMIVGRQDFPAIRIMRTKMNEMLVEACTANGINVHYGKQTKEIKETDSGVELRFEDGSSAKGEPVAIVLK